MDGSSLPRHATSAVLTSALLAILTLNGACAAMPEEPAVPRSFGGGPSLERGCASDKDCKGDRVCESGRCVAGSSATPRPDQPTPPQPPSLPRPPPGVPTLSDGDG